MNSVIIDAQMADDVRREHLYQGQLLVYSPTASSLEFCDFARDMVTEAFEGLDPQTAQYNLLWSKKYAAARLVKRKILIIQIRRVHPAES